MGDDLIGRLSRCQRTRVNEHCCNRTQTRYSERREKRVRRLSSISDSSTPTLDFAMSTLLRSHCLRACYSSASTRKYAWRNGERSVATLIGRRANKSTELSGPRACLRAYVHTRPKERNGKNKRTSRAECRLGTMRRDSESDGNCLEIIPSPIKRCIRHRSSIIYQLISINSIFTHTS